MGQAEIQNPAAAGSAQRGLAAPPEERIPEPVLSLECSWEQGWVMGAV